MPAASIAFRNVVKRYGDVVAVDDVSFDVAAGTLVTLLGPSGCGKTTILRLVAGLETASSGAIRIGARDVTTDPAAERDVSMVFQSYALFPHMSVLENVRYGLVVSGMERPRADERARSALSTVGLAGYDARLPSELSGGQQQRVAVARTLVLEPAVLLFDEPLSNLDARLRRQMRDDIRELQQRLGLTVVYVTHDQAEAMAVSDRIIVMDRGVIAQEGTPRDLYRRPRSAFVAAFMGDANRLAGRLTLRDDGRGDVRIGPLVLGVAHGDAVAGDVEVAIRAEAVELTHAGRGVLDGTLRKAAYLGSMTEYSVETPIGTLFGVAPSRFDVPDVGARVGILIDPHGVVLLPPASGAPPPPARSRE